MPDVINRKEEVPFSHYLSLYQKADPLEIQKRCDLSFDGTFFDITLMGTHYRISFPDYEILPDEDSPYPILKDFMPAKILILRYLTSGKHTPFLGKFLTYREFPWGEVYFQNFFGRCMQRFAFSFGTGGRLPALKKAMDTLGATPLSSSDMGYEVSFLNDLKMQFLLWEGDDEFPPSSQILFSDHFSSAFSAEDMAFVGDIAIAVFKKLS